MKLPDPWERLQRVCGHAAKTAPGWTGTYTERYDAALDAAVTHIAEHGWPDNWNQLASVCVSGITAAADERVRQWRPRGIRFWTPPPAGIDALAEHVTEKIAIHQVTQALTHGEWEVISALAATGSYTQAAELTGRSPHGFEALLTNARRRARSLWVAPGEHARGHYAQTRGGNHNPYYAPHHRIRRNAKRRAS
jgi:hypothetical protein